LTDDGPATAAAMLDGDTQAASQFIVFGQEADGSAFGLWCYQGRKIEDAPIVYLGSEGTGWTVLANSLEEFIALLLVGADDLGFQAESLGDAVSQDPAPGLEIFRINMDVSAGIAPAKDPAAVVANARRNHPDLQKWPEKWQESHFRK